MCTGSRDGMTKLLKGVVWWVVMRMKVVSEDGTPVFVLKHMWYSGLFSLVVLASA